jgi:hypothetical protein
LLGLTLANSVQSLLVVAIVAAAIAGQTSTAQSPSVGNRTQPQPEFSIVVSADHAVEVRYPKSLLVCKHNDGENPDVWSPNGCAADIPVCDTSGHSGNVLLCLAYPTADFRGSELQAAAFAVSRIDNFNSDECTQKWARINTTEIHSEKIGSLKFQLARAEESERSHVADQHIYRIYHKACYELDINVVIALDTAFAAEDVPRKLTAGEREQIMSVLEQALAGFRFVK